MTFDTFEQLATYLREICNKKKIYIWGVGAYGDLLGRYLNNNHIEWFGYYDNYVTEAQNGVNGKAIIWGKEVTINSDNVYVLSMRNYEPVMEQLVNIGIDKQNIISLGTIEAFNELEDSVLNTGDFSKQIEKFHNIHKGESCFVIGNGPSLSGEDLNKIKENKIYSFGCNSIYKAYDKTMWRPDYYVVTDVNGIAMIKDDISYIADNCQYIFSRSNGRMSDYMEEIENIRLFKYIFSDSEEQFSFTDDCAKQVYIGQTVTYVMLQLAVYMGFEKIYLLGVDHHYSKQIVNGEEESNKVNNYSNLIGEESEEGIYFIDKTTLAYIAAKKYADEHGIKIYNATRGGMLEVFERVDFDTIFEKEKSK